MVHIQATRTVLPLSCLMTPSSDLSHLPRTRQDTATGKERMEKGWILCTQTHCRTSMASNEPKSASARSGPSRVGQPRCVPEMNMIVHARSVPWEIV